MIDPRNYRVQTYGYPPPRRQQVRHPKTAKEKFERMGFKMLELRELDDLDYRHPYRILRGAFQCVCGRIEQFMFRVHSEQLAANPDIAYDFIEGGGSLSREHLEKDGYTDAQIDEMMARIGEPTKAELEFWKS